MKIHAAPLSSFGVCNGNTPASALPQATQAPSLPLVDPTASSNSGASNVGPNAPIVRVVSDDARAASDYQHGPRVNHSRHREVSNSLPLQEHSELTCAPAPNDNTLSAETVPVALDLEHDQPRASQPDSPSSPLSVDSALVPAYSPDLESETEDGNDIAMSSKTPGGMIAQSSILKKRGRDATEEQTGDEGIPAAGGLVADKKNVVSPINKRAKMTSDA